MQIEQKKCRLCYTIITINFVHIIFIISCANKFMQIQSLHQLAEGKSVNLIGCQIGLIFIVCLVASRILTLTRNHTYVPKQNRIKTSFDKRKKNQSVSYIKRNECPLVCCFFVEKCCDQIYFSELTLSLLFAFTSPCREFK